MSKFDSHKWIREHREGKFNEASFDRAAILTLVKLNREVDEGVRPYEEKLKFMSLLEPWQIKEANNYFD